MRIRKNKISGTILDVVDQGVDVVASLMDNADLDARFATGHEQAAKVLAQLPIVAPRVVELKRHVVDGVHHVAQSMEDQHVRSNRSDTTGPRWRQRALLLALGLGAGATIAQAIRRRQPAQSAPVGSVTNGPKAASPVEEEADTQVAATKLERDNSTKGSTSRNGSAAGAGKAPSNT